MTPIKFEEDIKNKLEKRRLLPSAENWTKLSQRLDANQKKPKTPIFWWLSIAATIVVMIAISSQLLKTNTPEVLPQIVGEQIDIEQQKKDKTSIEFANEKQAVKEDINNTKQPQIIDYKEVTRKSSKTKTQFVENKTFNASIEDTSKKEVNKKDILTSETIVKETVAKILNALETENILTTDKEVDSLLKIANKELFKNKLQKETSKTVDANALLQEVEDDMGESFRTKVFEALKESYKTVKTAVVERNN